jgi:hypothetical protein
MPKDELFPAIIRMFFNTRTHKYVSVFEYLNSSDKSIFKERLHHGFVYRLSNGNLIISNFTSSKTSLMSIDNLNIKYQNIPNTYSDDRYMNQIKIFDSNLFNYFMIQHDLPSFINFFQKKDIFKNVAHEIILRATIKDFFKNVLVSENNNKLEFISLGKPNSFLDCEKLIIKGSEVLKLNEDDISTLDDFIQNIIDESKTNILIASAHEA